MWEIHKKNCSDAFPNSALEAKIHSSYFYLVNLVFKRSWPSSLTLIYVLQYSPMVILTCQFRNISIQKWEKLGILVITEYLGSILFSDLQWIENPLTNPSVLLCFCFPVSVYRESAIFKLLSDVRYTFLCTEPWMLVFEMPSPIPLCC